MNGFANGREFGSVTALRQCLHTREEDGERCRAYPRRGSDYCFQHDPALEEERQALLAGQGRRAGAPIVPEALPLKTPADVQEMLRKVAAYLLAGERIEPRRVTALTGVADRLLRAMELTKLQAELAAVRSENEALKEQCAEYERLLEESESGQRTRPTTRVTVVSGAPAATRV